MHAHEISDALTRQGRELRGHIPDVYAAYAGMQRVVMADSTLTSKTKELIALAIAATRECDGCIVAHGRSAARAGATEEEVAEAMGVVILMNGGPGTVWGPRALAAYKEYASPEQ